MKHTRQWPSPVRAARRPDPVTPSAERSRAIRPPGPRLGPRLMMLACCVPMLLIAFALVASGTAGAGAILFALLCAAMMAAMMFAMPGHKH